MYKVSSTAAASVAFFLVFASRLNAAELRPDTAAAFDAYIKTVEARMDRDRKNGKYLVLGKTQRSEVYAVEGSPGENGQTVDVPGGVVQHWLGGVFLPGANLRQVRAVMQDYAEYARIYNPDVIASKLIRAQGDDFDIFLRLYKKNIVTVVFNANYRVHYSQPSPDRMLVRSVATRIAEAADAGKPGEGELPPGKDRGFLWRLNSYWRFEEATGGVYAECEVISLSRDVPRLFQGVVNMFVRRFPRESMKSVMEATRREVLRRLAARS